MAALVIRRATLVAVVIKRANRAAVANISADMSL
jgi:hypothetical protein